MSDDALAYHLLDRRSVQSFLGRENSGKVPAAKTIWRWRVRLKTHHLMKTISAAGSDQLEKSNLIARGGQIIAASIVKAPIQRTTRDDNAPIKTGDTVTQWSDAQRAQKRCSGPFDLQTRQNVGRISIAYQRGSALGLDPPP